MSRLALPGIRQLRQEHLARFIDVLNQLVKSYRKSPKDRLKSLAQIVDAAQGKPVGLSPTTINRNIDYIGQLLKKARSEGFASVVMLDPGRLRERKSRRDRDERPAFTLEDIGKIFSHPIRHGWKSKRHWQEPGPNLIRDGLFWVPMIAALTGTRRAEIAVLGVLAQGDTFEVGGVIYEVRGEPLRDALCHVWKAEAREV